MRFQEIYYMRTNLNGIGFQKYVCQILKKNNPTIATKDLSNTFRQSLRYFCIVTSYLFFSPSSVDDFPTIRQTYILEAENQLKINKEGKKQRS